EALQQDEEERDRAEAALSQPAAEERGAHALHDGEESAPDRGDRQQENGAADDAPAVKTDAEGERGKLGQVSYSPIIVSFPSGQRGHGCPSRSLSVRVPQTGQGPTSSPERPSASASRKACTGCSAGSGSSAMTRERIARQAGHQTWFQSPLTRFTGHS